MRERGSLIQMVLARLERISADSRLAHRASGVRGSLLRSLENQADGDASDANALDECLRAALSILREAAAAIPDVRHPD